MNDVGPNSSLGDRIMILAVAWLSAWHVNAKSGERQAVGPQNV